MAEYVAPYMRPKKRINPAEQQTNIWKLEHQTFLVRVRYIDLLNHDELKVYGMVSTGDDYEDRCNAHERVTIAATIPKLLYMYRNHIAFYLTEHTDDQLLYNIIYQHLYDWDQFAKGFQGNILIRKDIPIQDLRDLSDIASIVYAQKTTKQKSAIPKPIEKTFFEVEGMPLFNFQAFGIQTNEKPKESEKEIPPHLEHTSSLDVIFKRERNR